MAYRKKVIRSKEGFDISWEQFTCYIVIFEQAHEI